MLRKIVSVFLLFLMISLHSACKSGDEEPAEYPYYLALLNLQTIEGVHFIGQSNRYECTEHPLMGYCDIQKVSESEILAGMPDNIQMTVFSEENPVRIIFAANLSHLESGTYLFKETITGTTEATGDEKRTLRLDARYGIPGDTNENLLIDVKNLNLLIDKESLSGSMEVHYYRAGQEDFIDAKYTLDLRKNL